MNTLCGYIHTVLFNYNFTFTRMPTHGGMQNVTLHDTRLNMHGQPTLDYCTTCGQPTLDLLYYIWVIHAT